MTGYNKILQEEFSKGKRNPIKEIFKYYFPIICKKIRELKGNRDDACDILQDVFVDIFSRPVEEKIKLKKTFETYLITVCINRWKSERKKRNRQYIINRDYQENLLNEPEIDEAIEDLKYSLFRKHISQLSKANKKLIELMLTGLSNKEIASEMKLKDIKSVENKKSWLIKQLKHTITHDPVYIENYL